MSELRPGYDTSKCKNCHQPIRARLVAGTHTFEHFAGNGAGLGRYCRIQVAEPTPPGPVISTAEKVQRRLVLVLLGVADEEAKRARAVETGGTKARERAKSYRRAARLIGGPL